MNIQKCVSTKDVLSRAWTPASTIFVVYKTFKLSGIQSFYFECTRWRLFQKRVLHTKLTRSAVLCVCFVDRCLSFCPFSFDHCVVCPSSIYELGIFKLFLLLIYNRNLHLKILFFITFPRQRHDIKHISHFKMFKERCFIRQWK